MGISFKVSKTGRRFYPKQQQRDAASFPVDEEESSDSAISVSRKKSDAISSSIKKLGGEARENKGIVKISDNEVSFTLNLFPDGYSIAKPVENEPGNQTSVDVPKFLHPYDRASEALFSAIESGRLPGDILDDIPCNYVDGTLVCEVRDYRKCFSEGPNMVPGDSVPIICRVSLKMSLENIVKDVPAISNGWTYGDLMEVESRILKAIQPQLCLDPSPQLDRLSENPVPSKLNFDLRGMRRKRLRQIPEVAITSNNTHGKKVCLDRAPESSRLGDTGSLPQQSAYENSNSQNNVASPMLPHRNNSFGSDGSLLASPLASHQGKYVGVGSPRMTKDQRSGSLMNASVASPGGQEMMIPFDTVTASIHGKRENPDGQSSPLANKRARVTHPGSDGSIQHLGSQIDALHGSDMHWKNTLMQQQSMGRGIQYANNGMQKFPLQVFEGGLNQEGGPVPFTVGQQGIRYNLKEEPVETERSDKSEMGRMTMGETELTNVDSQQARLQQRMQQQQYMRSNFPQTPWNNIGQPLDNNSRNEQKRKLVQSPHVSAGGLPQSPLSSKSGEFSSGSMGHQFGGVVNSALVSSQKEKSAVTSVPSVAVGGNPSFTSSANDSMQRQNQAQAAAKRRSNSLPRTPAISGVGSPASVGNMSVPINASSSPVGTQSSGDQNVLERFSKIEMVAMRFQLNCKKNKVDECPIRKHNTFYAQVLTPHLQSDSNNENLKDETCTMPLSKSLVGGSMNICKTRILNFIQTERIIQGNNTQIVPKARTRLIMSEKPNDGAVAIHIGEIEDAEYVAAEDYLPTLPNTHIADVLAAQYSSLMAREGYHVEDHIQPKSVHPVRMNPAMANQLNSPGIPPGSEMQQFSDGVSMQQSGDIKPTINSNAPINPSQNAQGQRMLPPGPGNTQAIQMSQGLLPGVSVPSRPQQPEQLPPMQQPQQNQQQHNPQFQRSMMLPGNSVQHLNSMAQNENMQLVQPHMTNKPSALQLQMFQQQQQQRKMMPSLGTVGMGNMSNNVLGLGGLGNVMMGGARGMGGSGISGTISNIGSMNQNPMNLSSSNLNNALRSGTLSQAAHAAALMKLKMQQGRPPNMLGNPQLNIGSMPGGRQMHQPNGLSMLNPTLNRANISQMQRTAMGPPKMMSGMNLYMNQQQQQQQQQLHMQQQQHLQLQQQQQQQQQQLQQETSSPLQAVVSPPQVGSPSNMGMAHQMNQQQQASPQQMSQRTPMSPQLSSGAMHPLSGANPEACPASPQLSSQTMGSVGSIANSPMEMQGVNKSNSVNNAQS